MSEPLVILRDAILGLDEATALQTTEELLAAAVEPQEILETGMTAALLELGERWKRGDAFLPEVIAAAAIFEKCNELVEPALLASSDQKVSDRFVVATVKGDLHDLGKNIVAAMLKTVGMEIHDLGKNVPTETIVEAVRELNPRFLGLSALLTTTMPEQQAVIEALEEAGLRSQVKVLVGGAPVTQEWADRIGADGYAPNAPEAVRVALELVASEAAV
jgi:corrinoid protein of di/trimethylamine methyltransferase